jgi:hypothetical protein
MDLKGVVFDRGQEEDPSLLMHPGMKKHGKVQGRERVPDQHAVPLEPAARGTNSITIPESILMTI